MERVLVTGATGRVGANLVRALVARGYHVRSYVMPGDSQKAKLEHLETEIFWGELGDLDGLRAALDGVDHVVHLACVMGRPLGMSLATYFDINVKGTFLVVQAAQERVPQLKRFVFASSDASYSANNPQYIPIDEKHPQRPYFLYGLIKVVGEDIVREAQMESGLPTVITRFGTVMAADEIISKMWRARNLISTLRGSSNPHAAYHVPEVERPWEAVEKKTKSPEQLVIPRNPEGKSWLHHPSDVRDTVEGIILALEKDQAVGEAFNILGPRGTTWEEAVKYIAERTNEPYVEVILPSYWAFECDISKARRILGYAPRYDIKAMVDSALTFRRGEDIGVIPSVM